MAISRVPGYSLLADLDRQGVDLQFTTNGTTLTYLDFANFRLGVNTVIPQQALDVSGNILVSNGHIYTSTNLTSNIGTPTNQFNTIYVGNIKSASGNIVLNNVLPTANTSGTLGSPSDFWQAVYAVNLYTDSISADNLYDSGNPVLSTVTNFTVTGDVTGGGNVSNIALTLVDTGVVAGIYGSADDEYADRVPKITVDSKGRITNISNVALTQIGNVSFLDTTIYTTSNVTIAPTNGYIFAGNSIISNVATPQGATDVVTVGYLGGRLTANANIIIAQNTAVTAIDTGANGRIEANVDGVMVANISSTVTRLYNTVNVANISFTTDTLTSTSASGNIVLVAPGTGIVQVAGSDALGIPYGDIVSRPANPTVGFLRFNTQTASLEYWNGTSWTNTSQIISSQVIIPDGVNYTYTLNNSASTEGVIVTINGTVQQPTTAYTVSGTQITFTELPLPSDTVEVRTIAGGGAANVTVSSLTYGSETSFVLTSGNLTATGNLSVSSNLTVSGTIIANSGIKANGTTGTSGQFLTATGTGGMQWTTLAVNPASITNGGSNVAVVSTNGNVVAAVAGVIVANIGSTGIQVLGGVNATNYTGTILTAAQPNVTSLGNLSSLSASGTIQTTGIVYGNSGVSGTLLTASQTNVTAVGNLTTLDVTGRIRAIGQIQANSNITSSSTSTGALVVIGGVGVSGNINAGNVNATNFAGTIITASQTNITAVGNLSSVATSGTVSAVGQIRANANITSTSTTTGALTVIGGVGITGNLNVGTDLTVTGNLTISGTTTTVNSTTLSVTDLNITVAKDAATASAANGAGLTVGGASATILYTSATDTWNFNKNIVGTLSTAAQTNITSLGNLLSLSASGTIQTTGIVYGNSGLSGTILTAAQTNITSVGNLTALSVAGATTHIGVLYANANITSTSTTTGALTVIGGIGATGNIFAANVTATNLTGTLLTAAQTNITSVGNLTSVSASGTIQTTGIVYGNSGVSGTLLTAAQTNITSVGNLTSLSSSGTIQTTGYLYGNSGIGGTLITAAQPNITSVGNLTTLDVTGRIRSIGQIQANASIASTSTTTGALTVIGGVGVTGTINTGGNVNAASILVTGSATINGVDLGYLDLPQNQQSGSYQLALSDRGKHLYLNNAGAQTITVPASNVVAWPVGTAITLFNAGTTAVSISTTGLTVYQAGTTNTGNRTLATKGLATLLNIGNNIWVISGVGIS